MFGKHFKSLYKGSMYGSGPLMFAIWGYVIANMEPDEKIGAQVELNPVELKNTIGTETVKEIEDVIERLCSPDPNSRSKEAEGRRLERLGQFSYLVINGAKYMNIKKAEERREAGRIRQARYRLNHKPPPKKTNKDYHHPRAHQSSGEIINEKEQMRIAREEEGTV